MLAFQKVDGGLMIGNIWHAGFFVNSFIVIAPFSQMNGDGIARMIIIDG